VRGIGDGSNRKGRGEVSGTAVAMPMAAATAMVVKAA